MDQSTLVEDEIVDGCRFLEQFARDGAAIVAAAWMKENEDQGLFLYVATQMYDLAGPTASYHAAQVTLEKLDDVLISISQLTLISPADPITQGLKRVDGRHPRRRGFPLRYERLGNETVAQAYVYSPHVYQLNSVGSMSVEDVSQEVLRLMRRGPGVAQSSRVVLKDGTDFEGVPLALEQGDHDAMQVKFRTDRPEVPRVCLVGDIAFIR